MGKEQTNLVVTGATSFLGTALVLELLAEGYQVYAVVRPSSANREAFEEACRSAGITDRKRERAGSIS